MGNKDKRIDAYISKSAEFAKPILNHLRKLVHAACPNVQETIKWSFPHFDYKGMMCSMAAFKNHCAFGFWKSSIMKDAKELRGKNEDAMGHLGKITSLKDLPPDKKITAWIKEAMKLNDDDVKLPERKKTDLKKDVEIPAELQKELESNTNAATKFNSLSPSHKREYIEWINEAKTEATKAKRIDTTIEWVSEGKSRNWKYMRQ
jgi:uncharacterized protein YdeI (YjbR/CyaY-like superfamily)